MRCQIEHEDALIVNRLPGLIASQSFLFTAYAIMRKGRLQARLAHFTAQQELPIQGSTLTLVLGHAAPMLLPPIFIGAWIMLLF